MNKLFLQMSSLSAANKAHEELQIIASKWHYVLVDDKVLENLVVELQQEIARINEKYTRCKDITMNVSRNNHLDCEHKGIFNIAVDGNFYISVHEVKSEVLSGRTFSLTDEDTIKFQEWKKSLPEHDPGCIQGDYSFTFTPTTICEMITIRRSDGYEIDITEDVDF